MEKKYLVYLHRNKVNGKCYVGQTGNTVQERWGANGCGYRHQKYFYDAIMEFGWDNFDHIVLEDNLSANQVNERERYWIEYYHALAPEGYCLTRGGSDHFEFSPESLQKRSEESKRRWENEEYRQTISQRRKEQWQNPEYREAALKKLNGSGRTPARSKKVMCVETGKTYYSTREAERETGVGHTSISEVCNGKRLTAKGLHWKFVEEDK